MSGIRPINLPNLESIEGRDPVGPSKTTNVGGAFGNALNEARSLENSSTQMAEKFANGDQSIGIHEVMIATEKSSIALRFATTLKNKAVEAYKELMNTQV